MTEEDVEVIADIVVETLQASLKPLNERIEALERRFKELKEPEARSSTPERAV